MKKIIAIIGIVYAFFLAFKKNAGIQKLENKDINEIMIAENEQTSNDSGGGGDTRKCIMPCPKKRIN